MVTITQLTPGAAQQQLANDGIAALGLTAPLLSPVWSDTAGSPIYDADALTFDFGGDAVLMPFLGILETVDVPDEVFDVSGDPVPGPITRIRLHVQAAVRLETLALRRYAAGSNPLLHPIPVQMVVRVGGGPDPFAPQWWEPGDDFGRQGVVSFHDRRGLIVDPVAAAAIFADLLNAYPALLSLSGDADQNAAVTDPGGVETLRDIASGLRVHVVNPHGARFAAATPGRSITRRTGDAVDATLDGTGLIDLGPGETLRATEADDTAEAALSGPDVDDTDIGALIRWGWSNGGELGRTPLGPPALPGGLNPEVTLPRQFLRLTAVDIGWHLLGNRSDVTVQGIPADDGLIPQAYQPKPRGEVPITYLDDGVSVLAEAGQVIDRLNGSPGEMIVAVSPALAPNVLVPPASGPPGRWPQFPAPDTGQGFGAPVPSPVTGLTAAFTADNDVVVTVAANAVPDGAAIRIYPRQFVEIPAINGQPSFVRGDGGAGIAVADNPTAVLLSNPFALLEAQPRPNPATLTMDIVVMPRLGTRRLFPQAVATVSQTDVSPPPDPFAAGTDIVSTIDGFVGSIAPEPLFGLPKPPLPDLGPAPSPAELARAVLSEDQPRVGPRLPTQGRFETMIVTGLADPGAAGGVLHWDAVVSGGRWSRETRSTCHSDGNPGAPAGPDIHTAGVRVGGDLALDVARQAIRRAQPILITGQSAAGWIVFQGGNNFNRPSHLPAGAVTQQNAGAGVMLKTISAVTETPEISHTAFPLPTDAADFQQMMLDLQSAMGIANPQPDFLTIQNEDRLATEVVKEFYHSRHGSRDALWALRRAIRQARELVYIEGPTLAQTMQAPGTGDSHEIDLVQELADRLDAMPSLRVVVCLSRDGDFNPSFQGFVRQALQARQAAADLLLGIDDERVAVFHPKGFPGRPAQIRSTTVVVDDCWSMVGTSHLRRRGMTFDGGADVVSMPYRLQNGFARNLADFRRQLMARKLGLDPLSQADRGTDFWPRLAGPRSAFEAVHDLLEQDGGGRIIPLQPSPSDLSVQAASPDVADPDGTDGATFVTAFAGFLNSVDDTS